MNLVLDGLRRIEKKRKWVDEVSMGNAVGNSTRVQTPQQFADIIPGTNGNVENGKVSCSSDGEEGQNLGRQQQRAQGLEQQQDPPEFLRKAAREQL